MSQKAAKRPSIIAKTEDGSPMVEVFGMKTEGDTLVMDVKALDSMRMDVTLSTVDLAKGMPVVKANKKAIWAFAKQLPGALRKQKKLDKEAKRRAQGQ
ncbi:MAG: hypothetical protein RR381_06215 [Raoultibacter sp.]